MTPLTTNNDFTVTEDTLFEAHPLFERRISAKGFEGFVLRQAKSDWIHRGAVIFVLPSAILEEPYWGRQHFVDVSAVIGNKPEALSQCWNTEVERGIELFGEAISK